MNPDFLLIEGKIMFARDQIIINVPNAGQSITHSSNFSVQGFIRPLDINNLDRPPTYNNMRFTLIDATGTKTPQNKNINSTGTFNVTLTAPVTPGIFILRIQTPQNEEKCFTELSLLIT